MEPSDEASVSHRISGKSEQNARRFGFVLTCRDLSGCPSPFYHPYPTRKNITAFIPIFQQEAKNSFQSSMPYLLSSWRFFFKHLFFIGLSFPSQFKKFDMTGRVNNSFLPL
jgi:hypothetical protein